MNNKAVELHRPLDSPMLPDKPGWEKTFSIHSASSSSVYRVARNKVSGQWGCNCPGYCLQKHDKVTEEPKPRKCKHLTGMGLSLNEIHGNNRITGKPLKQIQPLE